MAGRARCALAVLILLLGGCGGGDPLAATAVSTPSTVIEPSTAPTTDSVVGARTISLAVAAQNYANAVLTGDNSRIVDVLDRRATCSVIAPGAYSLGGVILSRLNKEEVLVQVEDVRLDGDEGVVVEFDISEHATESLKQWFASALQERPGRVLPWLWFDGQWWYRGECDRNE